MKQCLSIWIIFLSALLLISCTHDIYPAKDLTKEIWPHFVETHPRLWSKGSDRWFLTGLPNTTERVLRRSEKHGGINTVEVPVPREFVYIETKGSFQVQIFGTSGKNTVFIYGPADAVKKVGVRFRNRTLYLYHLAQAPDMPQVPVDMNRVIIRIGVKNLKVLKQRGWSKIEAFRLCSDNLGVITTPASVGNIYLSGSIKLRAIDHNGSGSINIFNAHTPLLDIKTTGAGSVNISGKIGVRLIDHCGVGDINIIGANTNALCIHARGRGKIGIQGIINLKEVEARDDTRVYVYYLRSDEVHADAFDNARIGLAGATRELYVNTTGFSTFEGRYLQTYNTYARAFGCSHMNLTATNSMVAAAANTSSIYYFGPVNLLTKFETGFGTIIPLGLDFDCTRCRYEPVMPPCRGEG